MYKKILSLFLGTILLQAEDAYWVTTATIIPTIDSSITSSPFPIYDYDANQILLLYSTQGSYALGSSVFSATILDENGEWSTPTNNNVGSSFRPFGFYDSNLKTVLATFANHDGFSRRLSSNTYTPSTGWGTASEFSSRTVDGYEEVFSSYNALKKQGVACFISQPDAKPSIITYDNGTWASSITLIPTGTTGEYNVFSCCNSGLNSTFLMWSDASTRVPYYAIYDENGNISEVSAFPGSITAQADPYCCYNVEAGEVFAAWSSNTSPSYAYYSIYSNKTKTWSTPSQINDIPVIEDSFLDNAVIASTYAAGTKKIFVAWTNNVEGIPYYTIYDSQNKTWSTPEQIPGTLPVPGGPAAHGAIYSCYNTKAQLIYVNWTDNSSGSSSFYATYYLPQLRVPLTLPQILNKYSNVVPQR